MIRIALVSVLASCVVPFEGDDPSECADGADNDRDGAFDCDDPSCSGAPGCDRVVPDTAGDPVVDTDADVDSDVDADSDVDDDSDADAGEDLGGPSDDAAGVGDEVSPWASPGENDDGDCVGEPSYVHEGTPWVSQRVSDYDSWTGNMCCGPANAAAIEAEVTDGTAAEGDLKALIDAIDAHFDDWSSRAYLCDAGGTDSDQMVEIFREILHLDAEAITTDWCSLKALLGPDVVVIFHGDAQGGNATSTFRAGASHWLILHGTDGTTAWVGDPGRSSADQGDHRAYTEASVRARYEARGQLAIVVRLDGGCPADLDGDGYGVGDGCAGADCNDGAVTVHAGATETCDGADQNCNGMSDEPWQPYYADADGDGWGTASSRNLCAPEAPYTATSTGDCNDGNAAVHPGASDTCDGIDSNCNGSADEVMQTWYRDADGDGYGTSATTTACGAVPPYTATKAGDCDDAVSGTHPGAAEVANYADDDCDGVADDGLRTRWVRLSWSNGGGCGNPSADFDHCFAASGTTCVGAGQGGGSGYQADGREVWVYPASLGNGAATVVVGSNLLAGLASCHHAGAHEHWYGTVDGATYTSLRGTAGWSCSGVVGYVRTGSALPGAVAVREHYNAAPLSDRMYSTVVDEGSDCGFVDGGTAWWAWTR